MTFNPVGFALAAATTADLKDRARAAQISILGGMLGPSPAGALLLSVAARDGRPGPVAVPASGGPAAPVRVQIPELPDDPDEARKVIESRGLVAVVSEVAGGETIGGVIGSDPEAGSIVDMGSAVTIQVSAGLEVPDVVGKEFEEAESVLHAAGFEEIERAESEKSAREGTVASQDPGAGSFADACSTVTLYVSKSKPRLSAARSSKE